MYPYQGFALFILINLSFAVTAPAEPTGVVIPPAPEGVPVTTQWTVKVNGAPVPVHSVMVFKDGPAFFCGFDMSGPVTIEAQPAWPVRDAMVRPLSRGVVPEIDKHTIRFGINEPGRFSVEPNGLTTHPLYVFANPPEVDVPAPDAPNVRYFGPGLHEVEDSILLESGQEVYLAAGAWLRAVMPKKEEPRAIIKDMPRYKPLFEIPNAQGAAIRGRGVVDLSGLDWGSRCAVEAVRCQDLRIEGVTFLDGPAWTVMIAQSDRVQVENLKLIGHRESNDGVDILNSRDVTVRDCFVRVGDDGVIIKTFPGGGEASGILVERCVIWNDKVRSIGITAETAEPIHGVRFQDMDIIHDLTTGWEHAWTMSIDMSDCGPIHDVCFENIRCEDTRANFIQVRIKKGQWATTDKLGPIQGVVFKDIQYLGSNLPTSEIQGNDAQNAIQDIRFENQTMGGKVIGSAGDGGFRVNEFVRGLEFTK